MVIKLLYFWLLLVCQISFAQRKDIDFKTSKKRGDITFKKKEFAHAIENYRNALAINPSCLECVEGINNAKKEQRKELKHIKESWVRPSIESKVEVAVKKPKTVSKPIPLMPEVLTINLDNGQYLEMASKEITQKEWENYCLNNDLPIPQRLTEPNKPVVNISYLEAKEYAKWLSKVTGEYYDLPTQAEWMQAKGDFLGSITNGWFYENAKREIHEVGVKSPNEYGLYDMEGNVSEWVNDWYNKDLLYEISEDLAVSISEANRTRLVCGCSIRDNIKSCDGSKNIPMEAGVSKDYIGFRIIKRDINE